MISIQEALAGVKFGLELEDDEMISDALVLMRITRMEDGRGAFAIATTTGTDDVILFGLVSRAQHVLDETHYEDLDRGED